MFNRGSNNTNSANRIDDYAMPSNIKFGNNASSKTGEIAEHIAKNKKAIIITDSFIVKLEMHKIIEKSLKDSGFEVCVYSQDAVEPLIEHGTAVASYVGKGDYGIVIGFGGGSSLDRAKIASCFASMPDKIADYVAPASLEIPVKSKIPKILIPTTSGTGSEVSNTAVVIVPNKDVGFAKTWVTGEAVLADAVIIDPLYMMNLPPAITASSGFDALSHCAEGILSKQANSFSDALGLECVKLVSSNLRIAYCHGNENGESRWNMAMAAMLGGLVISYGWVAGPATLGHVASEGISPMLKMTHGDACAVLLPYVYWFNFQNEYAKNKLAMIAEAMGINTCGYTKEEAAISAIKETFNLLEDINIKTNLKDYGMKKEDIKLLAKYILERGEEMYSMSKFNPKKATLENLEEFFEVAYEGRAALESKLSKY